MSKSAGRSEAVRLTIRLSPEARDALEQIKKLGNLHNLQDAVRRAIGDELFLQEQMADGWNVLLEKDSKYREVVWPKF